MSRKAQSTPMVRQLREGEWTWDQVDDLYRALGIMGIVKCHNAALGAEREYGSAVTGASISAEDEIRQLREKVAACHVVISDMRESNANFGVRQERDEALKQLAEANKELKQQLLGSKQCPAPENELGDSSGDVSTLPCPLCGSRLILRVVRRAANCDIEINLYHCNGCGMEAPQHTWDYWSRPDLSERDWSEHLRIQLATEVAKVNKLQERLEAEEEISATLAEQVHKLKLKLGS